MRFFDEGEGGKDNAYERTKSCISKIKMQHFIIIYIVFLFIVGLDDFKDCIVRCINGITMNTLTNTHYTKTGITSSLIVHYVASKVTTNNKQM